MIVDILRVLLYAANGFFCGCGMAWFYYEVRSGRDRGPAIEWSGQSCSEMISPECPSCGRPEVEGHAPGR